MSLLLRAAIVCWAVACVAGAALSGRPVDPRSSSSPGPVFEEVARKAGLDFRHQFCHRRIASILLSNGSGGAVLDYDGDGWVDLFLVNWGPLPGVTRPGTYVAREPNRLYRNRGDGTFDDVTSAAGLEGAGFASAAAAADFDNDGHVDLFVAVVGTSQLYRNRGDGTFEEVARKAGVAHVGTGISATVLDLERDGFLDLFLANYLTFDPATVSEQNPGAYPGPMAYPGELNVLYRNRGDGTFDDVSRQAGIQAPGNRAMSVTAFDHDEDGSPDLYVSNDDTPNALWRNDGRGRFTDVAFREGVALNSIGEAPGSMNASVGDVDGDGRLDLFVTRLGYGSLYVRNEAGCYDDRMFASGLGRITQDEVGWGGCFLDFDNDGHPDLVIGNGSAFTLEGSRSMLLWNRGDGTFGDVSDWGGLFFGRKVQGRGTCALDLDNDGRRDVLMTTLAGAPALLANRLRSAGHSITFDLVGTVSNRDGFGAVVEVRTGRSLRRAQAICPTGFLTQGDRRVHFGLGPAERVDECRVRWPGGRTQVLTDLPADRIVVVREPAR